MPNLDWIGKKAVVNHHREVPYRLLHCDKEKSFGDPEAGNLLVQGDNLEALKALLPYYAGQVKCIYIDPPYNTGNESWVYNDNVNSPEIKAWLGKVVGKEAEDLSRHDKWLCMMYPRLRLLKEFLREDGSIWISIDDNEAHALKLMCDEIFGRQNFMFQIAVRRSAPTGHKTINPTPVQVADYVIIYARNRDNFNYNPIFIKRDFDKAYNKLIDNYDDGIDKWKFTPLKSSLLKKNISIEEAVNKFPERIIRFAQPSYEGVGAETRKLIDHSKQHPKQIFVHVREGFPDIFLYRGQRILFYKDKLKDIDGSLVTGELITNVWTDIPYQGIASEGSVVFPKGKKPEKLISRAIKISTNPNDLVLDSFAGSGTTGAVAHKMGRRHISVEMGEHAHTHIVPRYKKVVAGEDQGGISESVNWQGGGGFRYCTLGAPLFDPEGDINEAVSFRDLAAHVFFCETGSPIPRRASGPLIGTFQDRAIYLLYSKDSPGVPSARAGNVLNGAMLADLPDPKKDTALRIVYAEGCTLSETRLRKEGVIFKHIPYQIAGA